MLSRIKRDVTKLFDLNRFQQGAITVASAAASAAVLYTVYPPVFVLCTMIVVVAHEFGHWWYGRKHSSAALPIFIPGVIFVVGMTMVVPIDDLDKMIQIYAAGPIAGMIAGTIILAIGVAIANASVILSSISLACCELYSITFGSDGRRIKRTLQAQTLRGFNEQRPRDLARHRLAIPTTAAEDH